MPSSIANGVWSSCDSPKKTPVAVPANDAGAIPARSTASQEVSSNRRCCGSIARALLSGRLKNGASKPPMSSRKAPHREIVFPGTPRSGSNNSSGSQRSAGISVTRSVPASSASQSSSGVSMPPGRRQAIPITAIGVTLAVPTVLPLSDVSAPRPSPPPRGCARERRDRRPQEGRIRTSNVIPG